MNEHIRFLKEIPLLPDSDLLEMMKETEQLARKVRERAADRGVRRQEQIARRLEALNRELKARGIGSPPWWAERG